MEIKNKRTVTRGEGVIMGKEREGTSQGTCMKDPWPWTIGWGLTVGAGVGQGKQLGE